jgi:hypothetical protein
VPPRIAGRLRSGRARTAPKRSMETAVSEEAMRAPGMPARTSIRYWSAPAAATPPGMIRPNALPASCDITTGNQRLVWSAMRWSSQTATNESASMPSATANHCGLSFVSDRHWSKTSPRLGHRR